MEKWEKELEAIRAIMAEGAKESNERIAELRELQEENAKGFAELRELQKGNAKELVELRELQEENAKGFAELRELQKENAKELVELKNDIKVMAKEVQRLNATVCGIEKSNGLVAEESFYNSLSEKKIFGGIHFDNIERNMYGDGFGDDNSEGEYDIVMLNGNSICIIEAKYKARVEDVFKLVRKQVKKFKKLFPQYSNYKYYLGIGGMSFTSGVERRAKELGVGILKLKGDVVEIHDENLKVY